MSTDEIIHFEGLPIGSRPRFSTPEETIATMDRAIMHYSDPPLSTPEDFDARTGARRLLVDSYELHADSVDAIRLAIMDTIAQHVVFLNDPSGWTAEYWADELWTTDRALRQLGIED